MSDLPELSVVEVRMGPDDDSPVLLLKESDGPRHLAIWMSASGAAGILAALTTADPDHPSAPELMLDLVEMLGGEISGVVIVGHQDGHFFSEIMVGENTVNARPSDAIAVALRAGVPIRVAETVLASVGIPDPSATEDAPPQAREEQVEKFREFLDSVNPDDF